MKKIILCLPALWVAMVWVFLASTNGSAACLGWATSCSEDVTVEVEVTAGDICIGTTGAFDFGSYTASATAQTVAGSFVDELWVEDLNWWDAWYYTTLQLSWDLTSGTNTIPTSAVSVKTPATGAAWVTTMAGLANTRVVVDAWMAAFQTLDSARTYIKRDTAANFWHVGQYGALPELQVVIPAYTPVGVYSSTLVYTLYEN